jgi:hypothetical protein
MPIAGRPARRALVASPWMLARPNQLVRVRVGAVLFLSLGAVRPAFADGVPLNDDGPFLVGFGLFALGARYALYRLLRAAVRWISRSAGPPRWGTRPRRFRCRRSSPSLVP